MIMSQQRYDALKTILTERRREILAEVQRRQRENRQSDNFGETEDSDIQEDIEIALIQMKAETIDKIDKALARLEENIYGYCTDCTDEISESRLRALPFAVRCKGCEQHVDEQERRRRFF
ncbi:MAG: TraR/DksA family transcriptional regulator [Parcubacteria group bacterium]|nr:TraR/DksA family transcriptional regulator [Parcubacteria group bacterium]